MNHSPAKILATWLIAQGVFVSTAGAEWKLFIAHQPAKPTRCAVLYDTSGINDGRLMSSGEQIVHHGIQLRIRSEDYQNGWVKIKAAMEDLAALTNGAVVIGADPYTIVNVSQTSSIASFGEENGSTRNYGWTVNFILTIT